MTGSYYAIENGELIQYPMKIDGSRDKETFCSVDWSMVAVEMPIYNEQGQEVNLYHHLKKIEELLNYCKGANVNQQDFISDSLPAD